MWGWRSVVDGAGECDSGSEIERLPVNGRRWQTFALLAPVVNADATGDDLLSFRGMAATQNSTRMDGASDDQSFGAVPRGAGGDGERRRRMRRRRDQRCDGAGAAIGGGTGRQRGADFTFSQEAVREFRVSGQNYSALYGHGVGGVIDGFEERDESDAWDGVLSCADECAGGDESFFGCDAAIRMAW